MWWWFILKQFGPLYVQCDNPYGLKGPYLLTVNYMVNLPDGTQRITSRATVSDWLIFCPTETTFVLAMLAFIGLCACVFLVVMLMYQKVYPLVYAYFSRPKQQTQQTLEEIMQELNKAAEDFLKQAK
jgi:hypothetical protein